MMDCKGRHLPDDKTCMMCKRLLQAEHDECVALTKERKETYEKKMAILRNCPHFKVTYCRDRHEYRACTRIERDPWGDYQGCIVSLDCEQYAKEVQ